MGGKKITLLELVLIKANGCKRFNEVLLLCHGKGWEGAAGFTPNHLDWPLSLPHTVPLGPEAGRRHMLALSRCSREL